MNLYKETFEHYAPKDCECGIKKYFIAENDKAAYDIVYGSSSTAVDSVTDIFDADDYENAWRDERNLKTDEEVLKFLEQEMINKIISVRGEKNLEDLSYEDLYYGLTYKGWELVYENITDIEIEVLKNTKIIEG